MITKLGIKGAGEGGGVVMKTLVITKLGISHITTTFVEPAGERTVRGGRVERRKYQQLLRRLYHR